MTTATATTPTELTGAWTLDTTHSSATFAVRHMVVATFRGRFERFDATLRDGRLEGAVDVGSIVVKDESLAAHLQSPDFFDAARHPEIRFASSSIERGAGDEVVVRGELTIKGRTEPVVAHGTIAGPHEDIAGNTKLGLSLATVVDRTAFGLNWNAPLPKGGVALANDVTLTVELELVQQEEG
jgi:polyisoprenoid-binding protein YceI